MIIEKLAATSYAAEICMGILKLNPIPMKNAAYTKKVKPYPVVNPSISFVEETIVLYQPMYANAVSLLSNSKKGLNAKVALDFLTISGFTYDEFQETFKTTVKTIQNYANHDLKLDASLSEKVLKSFELFKKGIEIFGSAESFYKWINTAAYGLGNQTPFSLMDTFTGITLIEEELIRIQFGDLA